MPNASLFSEVNDHETAILNAKRVKRAYSVITGRRKGRTYNYDRAAELALHFAPGNIVFSDYWKTYDLVLEFHPTTKDRGWYVEVVHCSADGITTPFQRARVHATHPDKRDRVHRYASAQAA